MTDSIEALPVLIVNPYNRCNCRCEMCEIWKRDSAPEMSWQQFERQLPGMEDLGVRWVVFSGGEPLMHSDLFRFCRELRKRNIRVTLLSSGLLLKRHAEAIVDHADDLIVSLDGPPATHNRIRRAANAFELLASGVNRLRALQADYPVSARCTVQRLNCAQLAETAQTARQLHLNSLSFLAADLHSTAFNRKSDMPVVLHEAGVSLSVADLGLLDKQIEALESSGECGRFVVESADKLRQIAHHFRCYLGLSEPVAPVCNAPWNSAVIEADGSVKPCFFHLPIGSLAQGITLQQVVNGPAATLFRAKLNIAENPICQRCVCSLNWKEGKGARAA